MIEVGWSHFKQFVDGRSLSIQFLDVDGFYYLWAVDGNFYIQSRLDKSNPEEPDLVQFETLYKAKGNKQLPKHLPFADKTLPCGRKLFTRIHGISVDITESTNIVDFIIPYNSCKITAISFIGSIIGDNINLKVIDTPTGTVSGQPNYVLNQFAFSMQLAEGFHKYQSDYDADLIKDLKLRLEINTSAPFSRKIGVNIILHEVR